MNHAPDCDRRIRIEEPHGTRLVTGTCACQSRAYRAGDESGWHTEIEAKDFQHRQRKGREAKR